MPANWEEQKTRANLFANNWLNRPAEWGGFSFTAIALDLHPPSLSFGQQGPIDLFDEFDLMTIIYGKNI